MAINPGAVPLHPLFTYLHEVCRAVCSIPVIMYRSHGSQTTQDGFEIDIVLQTPGMALKLIEIKSATRVDERSTKSLVLARKDFPPDTELFLLSQDELPR
jgi:hypothetical protein